MFHPRDENQFNNLKYQQFEAIGFIEILKYQLIKLAKVENEKNKQIVRVYIMLRCLESGRINYISCEINL